MKANNLLVLKALLDEVLICFEAEGQKFTVIRRFDGGVSESLNVPLTIECQRQIRGFRKSLRLADDFESVGKLACLARTLSLDGNFYFSRDHLALNERLIAICVLAREKALAREDWCLWNSTDAALTRWEKYPPRASGHFEDE